MNTKLPDEEKHNIKVLLLFSRIELDKLDKEVKKTGMYRIQYIRQVLKDINII